VRPIYLLDTNTVSYILTGRSSTARRKLDDNLGQAAISTITEGELRFGLAKNPNAVKLRKAVESFLAVITVLPWDSAAARSYGVMRAKMAAAGTPLGALDMMIASHAASLDAILVTTDKAFRHAEGLHSRANWATDL
jgi:tRNA(fMet)-specific endonuclease VapC